jgi:hypothetical protein
MRCSSRKFEQLATVTILTASFGAVIGVPSGTGHFQAIETDGDIA